MWYLSTSNGTKRQINNPLLLLLAVGFYHFNQTKETFLNQYAFMDRNERFKEVGRLFCVMHLLAGKKYRNDWQMIEKIFFRRLFHAGIRSKTKQLPPSYGSSFPPLSVPCVKIEAPASSWSSAVVCSFLRPNQSMQFSFFFLGRLKRLRARSHQRKPFLLLFHRVADR